MLPDLRSIIFTSLAATVVCFFVSITLWRQSRRTFEGMDLIALDFAAQVLSLLLILLRGNIPDWASIVLANGLVFVGSLLGYIGLQRFVGRRSSQVHNWILVVTATVIHAWFGLVRPDLGARNLNLAVATLAIWGQSAWLMLRGVEPRFRSVTRGVGLVFASYCAVNAARIVEFFVGPARTADFLSSGTFDRAVIMSYQLLFIILTFALALMLNRRLSIDVAAKQEKFSRAFRSAPYALFLARATDGRITEVNDGFLELLGLSVDEVIGKTPHELGFWESDEQRHELRAEVIRSRRVQGKQVLFRNRSGQLIHGLASAELIDIEGIPHILTSANDISDLKRAEAALRTSEERHRVLLASLSDAVIATDADGRVVFTNAVADHLTGWPSSEACGRPLDDVLVLVDEASRKRVESPAARVLRTTQKSEETGSLLLVARDASETPVEESAAPIRDDAGSVVGAVLVFRNVSELRRERQAREDLQASLAQSDRLASMGMLAASVAHEINNPLSYVLYNLEFLAEHLPRVIPGSAPNAPAALKEIHERLRETLAGARRIHEITRGLGTFSRVEGADLAPVDVRVCLEHALTIAANEIRFRATVARDFGEVPPVLASEGKLAQVFLNLLMNAAHAIEPGRVDRNQIRVRAILDGSRVRIEIADTGTGIPPQHHERLFDPFFTTKPIGSGSGLGLWIVRNLVSGFGGEVSFTSQEGSGSCFVVTLPPAPNDLVVPKPSTKTPALPPAGTRRRILVVDDEAPIRNILSRILSADHDVVTASSGAEARGILEQDSSFDAVLCDLMMPKESGMDLHAAIARSHPPLAARFVFITGGAFAPGAAAYLAQTGLPCLEKPFKPSTVKLAVADILRQAVPSSSSGESRRGPG